MLQALRTTIAELTLVIAFAVGIRVRIPILILRSISLSLQHHGWPSRISSSDLFSTSHPTNHPLVELHLCHGGLTSLLNLPRRAS